MILRWQLLVIQLKRLEPPYQSIVSQKMLSNKLRLNGEKTHLLTAGTGNQKVKVVMDNKEQGAIKPGSMGELLPGNVLSHRKFEVNLGNNARNILSPQSVGTTEP